MKLSFNSRNLNSILAITFLLGLSCSTFAQSPQKYFDNGMYEQAFVEAAYKQNKKVKLKEKYTDVIYKSYDIIYADHQKTIVAPESNWKRSYNRFIRLGKFRAKIKHEGVKPKIKDSYYDENLLNPLAIKFNNTNQLDLDQARIYENNNEHNKALPHYQKIKIRHNEVKSITELIPKLNIFDYQSMMDDCNQIIGDKYIEEAVLILGESEHSAEAAIDLVNLAAAYRPLSVEEKEIITLANLIKGEAWIKEAKKLVESGDKHNGRMAFELVEKAKKVRALTAEEVELGKQAESLGMTRVLISLASENIHTAASLSADLNSKVKEKWVTYYFSDEGSEKMDFEMLLTESAAKVVLGKVDKKVEQTTREVVYYEDVVDANGKTTKVKKTRQAVGIVATLTQTKTATVKWSAMLKNLSDNQMAYNESNETIIELTHQYASVISGDALALPENTTPDVDLSSQPFPTDQEMKKQIEDKYKLELKNLIKGWQIPWM